MTTEEIENSFLNEYGYLENKGMVYNGIYGNESDLHHSVTVPFIFDHREIPKKFAGIKVQVGIIDFPMKYFPAPINDDVLLVDFYDPEKYKKFVHENFESLRHSLNLPLADESEILDALARGSFQEHIKWWELKRADFKG